MKNHFPVDDIWKSGRIASLVGAVIFSFPAYICTTIALRDQIWMLFWAAFFCLVAVVICIWGYLRQRKEFCEFLQYDWSEEKVQKIMTENAEILRNARTDYLLISPETITIPRSVSLELRLMFLFALVTFQRYNVGRRGEGPISNGFALFIIYTGLIFVGTALLLADWRQDIAEKVCCVLLIFSPYFILWLIWFLKGCRVISLLRHGHVTCGVSRSHYLTGNFFQFNDENGNMHWKYLPYDTTKKPKKITVLYDPRKPSRCLMLDELVRMKQVQITENGGFRIDFQQIQPIFIAIGIWIAYGGFFLSFWLQKK